MISDEFMFIFNKIISANAKQGKYILINEKLIFNNVSNLWLHETVFAQIIGNNHRRIFCNEFDVLMNVEHKNIIVKFDKRNK